MLQPRNGLSVIEGRARRMRLVDERGEEIGLPSGEEIEQSLLGMILMWNATFHAVQPIVTAEMFVRPLHRRIFEIVAHLIGDGLSVTPVTLRTYLPSEDLTGPDASRMAEAAAPASTARSVAMAVRESWRRRQLLKLSIELAADATTPNVKRPATEIIADMERRIGELIPAATRERTSYTFAEAATEFVDAMAEAYKGGTSSAAIASGLEPLDAAIGGFFRSDFVVIAGRPGMGKTAFVLAVAMAAARQGHRVGMFSMEMPKRQIAGRALTSRADVAFSRARRGEVQDHEFESIIDAAREFADLPITLDETPALSIIDLMARARTMHRRGGLDMVIVDYIQLMKGSKKSEWNRTQELSEITQGLKALAKELNCVVIGLSQLSRDVEKRDNKRPQLSDLRESGAIEQDADVVAALYREAYYLKNSKPDEGTEEFARWEARMEEVMNVCEYIMLKDRGGESNRSIPLAFEASRMRFSGDPVEVRSRAKVDAPLGERSGGNRGGGSKKESIPVKATFLFDELRSMTLTARTVDHPPGADIPKEARCIAVADARERFRGRIGTDVPDATLAKEFRAAMVILQKHGIAAWGGNAENPVVYIRPGKV